MVMISISLWVIAVCMVIRLGLDMCMEEDEE